MVQQTLHSPFTMRVVHVLIVLFKIQMVFTNYGIILDFGIFRDLHIPGIFYHHREMCFHDYQ